MKSNGRIIPPFITDQQLKEVRSFLSYKNNNMYVPIIKESFDFYRVLRNLDNLSTNRGEKPSIGQFVHSKYFVSTSRDYLFSIRREAFKAYQHYVSLDDYRISLRNRTRYDRCSYGMIVGDKGQEWIVQAFTGDEAGRHMRVGKGDMDVLFDSKRIAFMKLWIWSVAYKYYIYRNKPTPAEQIVQEASQIYGEENIDFSHYLEDGYQRLYSNPSNARNGVQVYANRLTIRMENFYITNKYGDQHKVEEFYVIVYFSTTGYMRDRIYGFRGTYEYKAFLAGYVHSHMNMGSYAGESFCMGDSVLYMDMGETINGFNIEFISLILYQIEEFVKWENVGNPHCFMEDIEAQASNSVDDGSINPDYYSSLIIEKYSDILPQISVDLSGEYPQVSVTGKEDLGFRLGEAIREDGDDNLMKALNIFRSDGTIVKTLTLQQAEEGLDNASAEASQYSIPFKGEKVRGKVYIDPDQYESDSIGGRWTVNPSIMDTIIGKINNRVSRAIILQSLKQEAKNQKNYEYKNQIKNSNKKLFGLVQVR